MCGICGVIGKSPRLVRQSVGSMMHAMVHRGPDDLGYEQLPLENDGSGPVAGFGFRRLSIQDTSTAGHQPMFHPPTGNCLIFNGEIYNFRALRTDLEAKGSVFRGTSDSEVLLHALSTWGEAALEKLQGMFALAFYESQSRRILLARDPLGIKPLYVAKLTNQFVFASEVGAVRASGLVSSDLDMAGIAGMLAYGAVQSPRTVFAQIRSFPAGSSQWVDASAATDATLRNSPRRFWSFPQRILDVDRPHAAATVRSMLHESVLRHLVADVPVGVLLSAGIDSTIIASVAREYTPQVTAFTVGFGAVHGEDEVPLATATAASLGIKHVCVELDSHNMSSQWHEWLKGMDSPSIDGFNTFVVSRRLAQEGVVVGLSGLGADELFGGYPCFRRAIRLSRILESLSLIPRGLRSRAVAGLGFLARKPEAAGKLCDLVGGDPSVAGITRSLRRALSNQRMQSLDLSSQRVGLADDYLESGPDRLDPILDGEPFNTVSRIELVHYMGDTLLRDTDANSMQNSLEVRLPFLDLPLVDYVSALPGPVKYDSRSRPKVLLRDACAGVFGARIANRPKTGFSLPIGDWMRGEMRESCEAAIDYLGEWSLLDRKEVHRTWESFQRASIRMHWSRPLSLVVLGNYLKQASSTPIHARESPLLVP